MEQQQIVDKKRLLIRCGACGNNGYSVDTVKFGVCHSCREIIRDDVSVLFRCADATAKAYGFSHDTIYSDGKEKDSVMGRRLISFTLSHLSKTTSGEIARLFSLHGKDISDSSIRHMILSCRDIMDVDKKYADYVSLFINDTLDQYNLSDNMIKSSRVDDLSIIYRTIVASGISSNDVEVGLLSRKIARELLFNRS
jgi:hypothetical protein